MAFLEAQKKENSACDAALWFVEGRLAFGERAAAVENFRHFATTG